MEVMAVLDALSTLLPRHEQVEVVSDSTYVVNCFRDRWWAGWIARGWRNSQKQPVANQDLWKPLIELYRANDQRVRFRWVKGHSGHPMNDLVDLLAVRAGQSQVGRLVDGVEPIDGGVAAAAVPVELVVVSRVGVSGADDDQQSLSLFD